MHRYSNKNEDQQILKTIIVYGQETISAIPMPQQILIDT